MKSLRDEFIARFHVGLSDEFIEIVAPPSGRVFVGKGTQVEGIFEKRTNVRFDELRRCDIEIAGGCGFIDYDSDVLPENAPAWRLESVPLKETDDEA